MTFRTITRGGRYVRVADPDWADAFDSSYSQQPGGRWNPPNSFGALYLNRDEATARLNIARLFVGRPYGIEDVHPDELPDLVETEVPEAEFMDATTDDGLAAAGLPTSYPDDADGDRIPPADCQPIGQAVWDADLPGVACRSAAPDATHANEELAWFNRGGAALSETARRPFSEWY